MGGIPIAWIVLLSANTVSSFLPFNPQACWDWWSYVNHSDSYVTKSGSQIRAIKAMLDALTARRGARGGTRADQRRAARWACGHRHLGHVSGSCVDAATGNDKLSHLAVRRRQPVYGRGRCDRSELCRFRPRSQNCVSWAASRPL